MTHDTLIATLIEAATALDVAQAMADDTLPPHQSDSRANFLRVRDDVRDALEAFQAGVTRSPDRTAVREWRVTIQNSDPLNARNGYYIRAETLQEVCYICQRRFDPGTCLDVQEWKPTQTPYRVAEIIIASGAAMRYCNIPRLGPAVPAFQHGTPTR
jgi:hypothetical protein